MFNLNPINHYLFVHFFLSLSQDLHAWISADCGHSGKKITMNQERELGKELFVDWMGNTPSLVIDPSTGEVYDAHFFVCTLGSRRTSRIFTGSSHLIVFSPYSAP